MSRAARPNLLGLRRRRHGWDVKLPAGTSSIIAKRWCAPGCLPPVGDVSTYGQLSVVLRPSALPLEKIEGVSQDCPTKSLSGTA